MRPIHISHSDGMGGADIAAYRLHRSLLAAGVDSRMAVAIRTTADPTVVDLPSSPGWPRPWLRSHLTEYALWSQMSSNSVHRSTNLVPSGALPFVNVPANSVVHLHWMGSDTMSIAEIGGITRPVVWTLHDSWAFTGAEHHPEDASDLRFASGYSRASRRPGNSRFDLDASVYRRKAAHWKRPFWLAAPSRHMADLAARSSLAGGWPCRVIPNPLDTAVFQPLTTADDIVLARQSFGLPDSGPLILFGASAGSATNKGWDLLEPALRAVAAAVPTASAVVFGEDQPASGPPSVGMPIHYVGRISDPARLAALYSAATVMVVPSRLESFSQTASEAQACGTPVVAFATSGLLDVVDPGVTGLLAEPFSPASLAAAITRVVVEEGLAASMGAAGRSRAVALWSSPVVASAYLEWYAEAIAGQRTA